MQGRLENSVAAGTPPCPCSSWFSLPTPPSVAVPVFLGRWECEDIARGCRAESSNMFLA